MTQTQQILQRWDSVMLANYATPQLVLDHGQGAILTDVEGRTYLDLIAGIAVNILGHAHPNLIQAVTTQLGRPGHTSNLYATEPGIRLAEKLAAHVHTAEPVRVFFANSGTEANEAAFKITRLTGRTHIVAAQGGFHGRTMGSLALTGQPSKQQPFQPLPGDIDFVPYGDIQALNNAVSDQTAAVFLEPIMGESGVITPPPGYLAQARAVTRQHGALLVLDEVQTGIGRTGAFFAHHDADITPDIITLAKGLAGGLPMGACITIGQATHLMQPGLHGSTFGGNPICAAAALAVLETIESDNLLAHTRQMGQFLRTSLVNLEHRLITQIRGQGLLIGIVLAHPCASSVEHYARQEGFLLNVAGPNIIRLAPPLVITQEQLQSFITALPHILDCAEQHL